MKYVLNIAILSLVMAMSAAVHAAPVGYSINSDSASGDSDSLYRIDMATGGETRLGRVMSLGQTRIDVEGLAFAPDGTLYGVDDSSMTLFPINVDNGVVNHVEEVSIKGLPIGGGNDFGLTFACDGTLYASSVGTTTLYSIELVTGVATVIGDMGHNISALAAYGNNPVKLYGLGNGLTANHSVDSRTLYEINPQTGLASATPQELGAEALSYAEAGISFDNAGVLWVITDRRSVPEGSFASQILTVDTATGVAKSVSTTTEQGFESLAITIPRGCSTPSGTTSRFTVQKRFVDNNNVTPVTLNINCTTGLPIQESQTVLPNEGLNGEYEVTFLVKDADDGEMSCTITEDPVPGYSTTYTCLGESDCTAAQSSDSCDFIEIANGSENLCQVQNYPNPVEFTVKKEWVYEAEELGFADTARITAECINARDHDGFVYNGNATWVWKTKGDASNTATVYPDFSGITECRAIESRIYSAVESDQGCSEWVTIGIGDAEHSCTIVNTVFFEGIPTLNQYGILLFTLLMLGTGMLTMRKL
jgi:hypothetical protein